MQPLGIKKQVISLFFDFIFLTSCNFIAELSMKILITLRQGRFSVIGFSFILIANNDILF